MILTKRFTFHAAHHIPDHPKCGETHGHTYRVEVSIDVPFPGPMYDFGEFGATVEPFIEVLDHTNLNEWFGRVPTAENIAFWLWLVLEAETELPLVEIKVYETENSWVTFRR